MVSRKRVFISFAAEDSYARDFLVGQARSKNTPFDLIDMSVKEAFDERWKTQCRAKIRGCHGVIALLSTHTRNASGARWEMWCANDEEKLLIGVHISKDNKGAIPTELAGKKVIEWTWDGIANFIDTL